MSRRPLLRLNYEDLAAANSSPEKQQLSMRMADFLRCDEANTRRAFWLQDEACAQRKQAGSVIFSKACSGYYKSYFLLQACRGFADQYFAAMTRLGYEELVDELFGC